MGENQNAIKLFENREIRAAWNEEQEEWYFSVTDVVSVLTGSADPKQYIKKMRSRDAELNARWGTICTLTTLIASDGKPYRTNAANIEGILRIVQSIPSPKAEPFKLWLAQVGRERIEETIDPELTIDRALETYARKGYTREWINQRLQAIQVRKELTDEWQDHGVQKGLEYAILTDEITRAWSGMTTRQYKKLKGLKKENLRDNMTTTELVLNMLAETSTTDISKAEQPQTFSENQQIARRGGKVAGIARQALEAETGKSVITSLNAADFRQLITSIVEDAASLPVITEQAGNEDKKAD
ncbi:MAG: BRO family protein [Oscillospiraceae bacterium]